MIYDDDEQDLAEAVAARWLREQGTLNSRCVL